MRRRSQIPLPRRLFACGRSKRRDAKVFLAKPVRSPLDSLKTRVKKTTFSAVERLSNAC
jgi:hypothetical protein